MNDESPMPYVFRISTIRCLQLTI